MGETVTHCGPTRANQVTKACNQIIVGCTLQAVAETLLFAQRAGADLEAVIDAVGGGAAGCWAEVVDSLGADVKVNEVDGGGFVVMDDETFATIDCTVPLRTP